MAGRGSEPGPNNSVLDPSYFTQGVFGGGVPPHLTQGVGGGGVPPHAISTLGWLPEEALTVIFLKPIAATNTAIVRITTASSFCMTYLL